MTDYIFTHSRSIEADLLSDMHQGEAGRPVLQVKAYYYKDARRRGLQLSVFRAIETDFGFSYDLMNDHNGLIHLADMPRKPSPKVAAEWAERIRAQLTDIERISLAGPKPDWRAIAALFASVAA